MKRLATFIVLFITDCTKKDEVAPVITIQSPVENQVFSAGQTITIKATVTDNESLHMVHVIAIDNTGGHWVHSEDHVDGKSFEIVKTFVTNAGKNYTISIDATDHDENTATKQINVSSNCEVFYCLLYKLP
jgi:short-subunit dehydrogenase